MAMLMLSGRVGGRPPSQGGGGSALFTDDFASGDTSHTENGVEWLGSGSRVTVVSDPGNASGFALRFRFGPDADCAQTIAEQRFYLGPDGTAGNYTELWVKYRMVIPSNFEHRTQGMCEGQPGGTGTNNKFLRLWHGDTGDGNAGYSQYDVKGGFSTVADSGLAGIRAEHGASGSGVGNFGKGPDPGNWIIAENVGNEVEYVMRVKTDTSGTVGATPSATGGNGALQGWRDGVLIVDWTTLTWRTDDGTGEFFEYGYVWGAPNSGYTLETDFLLREIVIAETNIFGV